VDEPQVSVLLPVRDGARWIDAACASVLGQSLTALELIIVDDGSTDETPSRIAALALSDRRVRALRQSPLGLVAALNKAIDSARAPLLARLDADDVALPERLARQKEHLDRHPGTVLLGTWAQTIDADDHAIGQLRPESDPARLAILLRRRNPFVHSTVMMRADAVRRVGAYREACRHAEDYDLWLRLAETGAVAILPEILVRYRIHAASVTRRAVLQQGFAARLARRAAEERARTGVDPLTGLDGPPDWWAPITPTAFHGEDTRLYRFLSVGADPPPESSGADGIDLPTPAQFATLNHAEKILARRAIRRLLVRQDRSPGLNTVALSWQALHGLLGWRLARGGRVP
jgi:GT2 family glycosyltransferase